MKDMTPELLDEILREIVEIENSTGLNLWGLTLFIKITMAIK